MIKALAPLLALLASLPAFAADLTVTIPGYDSLVIPVPDGWQSRIRRSSDPEVPPTAALTAGSPVTFLMLVTPMGHRPNQPDPTMEELRRMSGFDAERAKRVAIESNLPLKELAGTELRGYYFSATDREPKPDDFKYMTQGMLMSRELRIGFTLLANGDPTTLTQQALEVLKTARRAPAEKSQ
jgi:hypothetical protein